MKRMITVAALSAGLLLLLRSILVPDSPLAADTPSPTKVYGEWRIRIRPDRGTEYSRLIQDKGLPLFREAGGRMVGWWTTLMGDLYEHVTIWEYDGMPAFEKAVGLLGKDERFHKFAALRDPLLSGEDSRFLRLLRFSERPPLSSNAKFVVHEIHQVPLGRLGAYFKNAEEMIAIFKKNGFKLAGPFQSAVGKSSEITYLFFYESLSERDSRLAALASSADGQKLDRLLGETVEDVTTRLLLPASFTQSSQ